MKTCGIGKVKEWFQLLMTDIFFEITRYKAKDERKITMSCTDLFNFFLFHFVRSFFFEFNFSCLHIA